MDVLNCIRLDAIQNHIWSKERRRPQNNLDMSFRCPEGSVKAHLPVLAFTSETIGRAVSGMNDVPIVILVPDFSLRIVSKSLELIYTGSTALESQEELERVLDFVCNTLDIDMVLDWNSDLDQVEDSNETPKEQTQPLVSPFILLDDDDNDDDDDEVTIIEIGENPPPELVPDVKEEVAKQPKKLLGSDARVSDTTENNFAGGVDTEGKLCAVKNCNRLEEKSPWLKVLM